MTTEKWIERPWLVLAAGVGLATAVALAVRRRRVSRTIREYTRRVRRDASPPPAAAYDPDDVADLPAPVRRYFETVLRPGQPHVGSVRLTQTGEFRLGGAESRWHPFTATQVYAVTPPGYVWDAAIELFHCIPARVVDAFVDGEGVLRANLLGVVPVASAGPDPRMNEAELQRYLSEAPWFPTALLPAAGVTWAAIDDRSARATIGDGDVTASVTYHFDETGRVERITADRYRRNVDATEPWVGRFGAYEKRAGASIPTEADVAWDGPDGPVPYWRATVTDIDYRTH